MVSLFGRRRRDRRVLVFGLDCASPRLIFDQFNDELPTLRRLMAGGTWGELESSTPCITVPAWSSMLSSRDPGVLGVYGFRNRADFSYRDMIVADSSFIKVKRVWDYVGEAGKQAVVVSVPQTYPPPPINGHLISGFLTPGTGSTFTYPAILKQEVLQLAPDYPFDVREFRSADKANLLQQIEDMTTAQFRVAEHMLRTKPWDFFIHVNIGLDRMHHGFWHFHDPQHREYAVGNLFEQAIRDYYKRLDAFADRLISLAGDDTVVLIVSDHGVSRMDGGICLNEWLWRNGWLALRTPPPFGQLTRIEDADIDWSQTRAWANGGYYGRVFLNVKGREPQGVVPPEIYDVVRDQLAAAIAEIRGPDDQVLQTRVFKPGEIYQTVNNIPPDLMVYFGDLHWRAVGSLGHGKHYTFENDTGPDAANHAINGMFILHDPQRPGAGRVEGHQLMDIAPTILQRMG
ncbi:MAG: phosphodiesterase, partial [Chloroflexi bacterium]|nr:phosphodiesterase [Chloroflexota bacterium]